jgi:hypothetical protein
VIAKCCGTSLAEVQRSSDGSLATPLLLLQRADVCCKTSKDITFVLSTVRRKNAKNGAACIRKNEIWAVLPSFVKMMRISKLWSVQCMETVVG